MKYTYCKLNDILDCIYSGGTPTTSNKLFWNGDLKWLSSGETGNRFIFDTISRITRLGVEKSSTKLAKKGSIVMACAGQGKTRGQTSYLFDDMYVNQSIIVLNPDETKVLSLYLFYDLTNRYEELRGGSDASSTRGSITTSSLKSLSFKYPQIHIQEKIVDILYSYDQLIENNNKRIKLLEQASQELYKEWFVRFRFPGYENAEFENGIPKGWKIVKLGEISNISTGKCNREDAEENGIYPLFDRSQEIKSSSTWIKDCEAIIVPGEGTSFIPRYYEGKFNLHQRCYCVNPTRADTGLFIFHTLNMNCSYFLSVATGATVPSLRQNNFIKMKFVFPNQEIVKRFNDISKMNVNMINNLKKQNQNLIKQRDLLLPRLMSGKLEVK